MARVWLERPCRCPVTISGSASRFLENAWDSRVLDLVSARMGMLPYASPRFRDWLSVYIYADNAEEVQMHIGSVILVIWLVIGGFAAGQRGDYKGSVNCSRAATAATTILAGPLNYFGVDPHINCTVQHPSN
jgi:hypothetical protein